MAILLGLTVAASFGSGDFLGGLASRRSRTLAVLLLVQLSAVVVATAVAVGDGGSPTTGALLLGAGAGILNVAALGCLYQGLAVGQIGQVAPLAAVVGACIPVGWALATGERPGAVTLVGVGLAIVAAALISAERDERRPEGSRAALGLAVTAGVGFGTSFILFAEASHRHGFWPVLSARVAALLGVGIVVLVVGERARLPSNSRWLAIGAGVLDAGATALLLVALRSGLVAVVAPAAALAPGFTVLHAWWYLRERASPLQVGGLALALCGLVLIAAG